MTHDRRLPVRPLPIPTLERELNRRNLLRGSAAVAAGAMALPFIHPRAGLAERIALAAQDLPTDAAPPEKQIYRVASDPGLAVVLDFYEQVYQRPEGGADLSSDPLVRLTKDFEIVPAAATSWEGSDDGKTWTFTLDQNLVWSDGNPVTAADWVKTFQYAADPAHAWDFSWFFDGVIKNWSEAIDPDSGVTPEEIGFSAPDEYTLVVETVDAAPYLPTMMLYSQPLSKVGLETTGPLYNTNPETAISSGPFILESWEQGVAIKLKRNETYAGSLNVPVQRVEVTFATRDTHFTLFESDEIDFAAAQSSTDIEVMLGNPETASQVYSGVGDFRVHYFFFDVTQAPFDNIKVRQAFSHCIDREAIQTQLLGPAGAPAYSYLAPGFPAANGEALKEIQATDVELAKQLFAEAGFPDGEGFPELELWLRDENALVQSIGNAAASMIAEALNIDISVSNKDRKLFTDSMNAKPTQILFGLVSYGMDYLDPSNMLSVWKGGGRHSWANDEFDAKLQEATIYTGAAEERIALFQEAERILVSDVPGVFIYFETPVQFIKPWVLGEALTPDRNGITSIHWPGYAMTSLNPEQLYIGADTPAEAE